MGSTPVGQRQSVRPRPVLAPTDVADEEALRDVIAHVHQIGWQLRLGEHIEGQRHDEKEHGIPRMDSEARSG